LFQDDIYVDTINITSPSTMTSEWLTGKNLPPKKINLQPKGMTPCELPSVLVPHIICLSPRCIPMIGANATVSQAPKTSTPSKAKFVPAASVMSEAEKKKQEMDALFAKAKADESSDDEPVQRGLAPPDDDW
jgi:hypothetical protein